jgi:hypothetical protein
LMGAMSRKVALIFPVALAGFLITCDIVLNPAHAADECLAAPNSPPSSGSHWYYRVERATQRKCWYIGPEGREVRSATPKIPPAQKTPVSPATSAAGEQPTPSEQVEEPPMPAHPAIAVSDPAIADALVAQTADPQKAAIATQRENLPAVQTQSTTESPEANAGAEAQIQRPVVVTKDTVNSGPTPHMRVLVLVPAALAVSCVLVGVFFPVAVGRRLAAGFGRRQVQVDRHDANWGATVQSERAATDVKAAIATPDQPTPQIGLPDDLKQKLRQVLQSLEVAQRNVAT